MIAALFRIALCACALAAAGAIAQAPPTSVFLEELTWTELRDQIRAGKTTIIVPIGGTEQNGPHMALGKHNLRVRLLSEKIARALGNALVAPVIAYVPEGGLAPPTAHMRFPGTITVPEETFEKTSNMPRAASSSPGSATSSFSAIMAGTRKARSRSRIG